MSQSLAFLIKKDAISATTALAVKTSMGMGIINSAIIGAPA